MFQSRKSKIAVIGGGPKAAAIAAKAHALCQTNIANVEVTIFEQYSIGANWSGKHGYTDGVQRLCTPAVRDIGYPYGNELGGVVRDWMHDEYSWAAYLHSMSPRFSHWVDSGMKPPTHGEFTAYLQWVVRKSAARVMLGRVNSLIPHGPKWRVRVAPTGSARRAQTHEEEFDAVVVSGPGPARTLAGKGGGSSIFDGVDFWTRTREFTKAVDKKSTEAQIVIIGGGGTAAAALSWIARHGYDKHEIVMVAKQGALFTRGNSVFENRLFSDNGAWKTLSKTTRDAFFKRLNRSVVWESVMRDIEVVQNLTFVDGEAKRYTVDSKGYLTVFAQRDDNQVTKLRPAAVINAAGFDDWWFLSLVEGLAPSVASSDDFRASLRGNMKDDLSFSHPSWNFPRLHVPAHSSVHGPGLGSLMTLGSMSDRVLRTYAST